MKHKKIIIWSAAAAVAIIGAISTVLYLRYGRLTPDLIMNAETVGSSSEIELIWKTVIGAVSASRITVRR